MLYSTVKPPSKKPQMVRIWSLACTQKVQSRFPAPMCQFPFHLEALIEVVDKCACAWWRLIKIIPEVNGSHFTPDCAIGARGRLQKTSCASILYKQNIPFVNILRGKLDKYNENIVLVSQSNPNSYSKCPNNLFQEVTRCYHTKPEKYTRYWCTAGIDTSIQHPYFAAHCVLRCTTKNHRLDSSFMYAGITALDSVGLDWHSRRKLFFPVVFFLGT